MSKSEGKGSVLLKLVILILIIVLVVVIIIPGRIWDQEDFEGSTARANIMSIYEAEKFFHRINQEYTTEQAVLINVLSQDSSILQQAKVVKYTQSLCGLMDSYQRNTFIKSIIDIDENIKSIMQDLENNKRNFRINEDIENEAEDIRLRLSELNSSSEFPDYVFAATYLDSLRQLRRDLTDFTLQAGASRASIITDTLRNILSNIKIEGFKNDWEPLSERVAQFVITVNRSELVKVTSVGDRIKDFKVNVDDAFDKINSTDKEQDISEVNGINDKLSEIYKTFLTDFIVTGKYALYKLSEADSLILYLTEDNFYSPVTKEMYKIIISDDSSSVKVESPVLLDDLKGRVAPVADKISELPILESFKAYLDTLKAIKEKGYSIRKKIRKNTDIFIKYKELEEIIKNFDQISVVTAYFDLTNFVYKTPASESYSDIKADVESALNGSRISHQAYEENFFGNLDTLHRDVLTALEEYNELLSKVRRLPRDITNFDDDIVKINNLLSQIKGLSSNSLLTRIKEIENELGDIFLFASEGTTIRVYGIFKKSIQNYGYISRDVKSWEEKEN